MAIVTLVSGGLDSTVMSLLAHEPQHVSRRVGRPRVEGEDRHARGATPRASTCLSASLTKT